MAWESGSARRPPVGGLGKCNCLFRFRAPALQPAPEGRTLGQGFDGVSPYNLSSLVTLWR